MNFENKQALRYYQYMQIHLKLYRGYVNEQELEVYGHVFYAKANNKHITDLSRRKHAFSVINMFRLKPLANAEVQLLFKGLEVKTRTMKDGYFRFTLPFTQALKSGWHRYEVRCDLESTSVQESGELLKPFESKYGIISDIDDTFLISHSNNIFKKLYVMLTKNVNKRKIFDDVVDHYQALSIAGQNSDKASNSFFYVSSSEWNLYTFITQFAEIHNLPKAVIKLKKLKKSLWDFIKTGRGDHDHKFVKIKDIISFYPNIQYVLLGDDSQQDVYLYERICKVFPMNIKAIYIRQTSSKQQIKVQKTLANIEEMNVTTYYFANSKKAIEHSKKIGLLE